MAHDLRLTRARPAPDLRLGPRLTLRLNLSPNPFAWRLRPLTLIGFGWGIWYNQRPLRDY